MLWMLNTLALQVIVNIVVCRRGIRNMLDTGRLGIYRTAIVKDEHDLGRA